MPTFKKNRAGDALNMAMFSLQLLRWTVRTKLMCVIMTLF